VGDMKLSNIINNEGLIPLSAQQLIPKYCSFIDKINKENKENIDDLIKQVSSLFDKRISFTLFQGTSSEGEVFPDQESWLSYTLNTLTQFTTNFHLLSVPIWTIQNESLNVEYSVQSTHINTSVHITIVANYSVEIKKIQNDWLIMNIQLRIKNMNSK
jgi:hypothetical protein